MPPLSPPADPTAQLSWLVDRAAISDLLVDFARALDDQDWEGYAANYTDDGVLVIMGKTMHTGREGLAENTRADLGRYAGTHHLSTNHAITIDGDTATTRSYLIAALPACRRRRLVPLHAPPDTGRLAVHPCGAPDPLPVRRAAAPPAGALADTRFQPIRSTRRDKCG
jgi:uncharacterized protein (TIGR02246 family)